MVRQLEKKGQEGHKEESGRGLGSNLRELCGLVQAQPSAWHVRTGAHAHTGQKQVSL